MNTRDYIIIGLVLLYILGCGIMLRQRSTIDSLQSILAIKTQDYEQLERNCNQEKELVDRLLEENIKRVREGK